MAFELLNLVETCVDIRIQEGQGVSIFFYFENKSDLKFGGLYDNFVRRNGDEMRSHTIYTRNNMGHKCEGDCGL